MLEVLNSTSGHYAEDCIKHCNFIMPELQITLGRQCQDYGISEEYSPQNPTDEQFANIDEITVTNMVKEILCEFVKIIVVSEVVSL